MPDKTGSFGDIGGLVVKALGCQSEGSEFLTLNCSFVSSLSCKSLWIKPSAKTVNKFII